MGSRLALVSLLACVGIASLAGCKDSGAPTGENSMASELQKAQKEAGNDDGLKGGGGRSTKATK